MAATSSASLSAFYECYVCHGLAPDLETLLHHNCAMYANSPANAAVSNDPLPTSSSNNLERWLDEDVRLLITTWAEHKHMFGSKATKKEVFDKIAEQFRKISGRLVTGEQCMRKWGKITSKQKEIEDHNKKTGNDKKSWKFYEELCEREPGNEWDECVKWNMFFTDKHFPLKFPKFSGIFW